MDRRGQAQLVAALHHRWAQAAPTVRSGPDEGLRERKKRLMRQHLSDTATAMFMEHGFDEVKVTEVAAACGVSEKTVYNYFPTKESLVLDRADALAADVRAALGPDGPGISPVAAAVGVLEADLREMMGAFDSADDGAVRLSMLRRFGDLLDGTPSLRAAQRDQMDQMVQVAAEAIAARAGLSPDDPEAQIAADAIIGLWRIQFRAMLKYADGASTTAQVSDKVIEEVRRAARLIETGLWASGLTAPAGGSHQRKDGTDAAALTRAQVQAALRDAKAAWKQAARAQGEALRAAHRAAHQRRDG